MAIGALAIAAGIAAAALPRGDGAPRDGYVIGAKNFSEQFILAQLIADRIAGEGATASQREGLGSAIAFEALAAGDIDVYVDYSGTIWANVMRRTDMPARAALLERCATGSAEHGIVLLGALGFENAYALAMRRDRAAALGVHDDRRSRARARATLAIGADFEFFARPEWPALRDGYGLGFATRREFESTFMYQAVATGEVDVITAFSSDGRIAANDLVVLEDPQRRDPAVRRDRPARRASVRTIRCCGARSRRSSARFRWS